MSVNELGTQLDRMLSPLFVTARVLIEEDEPSLDKIVGAVNRALDRLRWQMISEVDFYVLEIRDEYVLVVRWTDDPGDVYYRVPYTLDTVTWEVSFGEWEQVVKVSEYRTLDGETLEEAVERIASGVADKRMSIALSPVPSPEGRGGLMEGWMPEGMSQNDLDDGDFAWLSSAYKKAPKAEKAKMNKREHRKLPYKIHGKVNVDGWKAAWQAAAHGGARAMKSYAGGPSKADVIAKLRRDRPKGIKIAGDNTITTVSEAIHLSPSPHPQPLPQGERGAGGEEGERTMGSGRGLLLTVEDTPIVEEVGEEEGRPYLVYIGTALVDNVVSGNGYFYDAESNDRIMEATNAYLAEGGVITVYSRHGKAVPGPLGELPTGLPVGKVVEPLWRDDNRIRYKARISPTAEGRDVMVLIEDGVVKFTSIRSPRGKYKLVRRKVNGREVDAVVEAVIQGIDLAEEPGIAGAGIDEILIEELVYETIVVEEEVTMDWKEVTMDGLRKERPDLVEELLKGQQLAEEKKVLEVKVAEIQSKHDKAVADLAQAQTEHEAKLAALTEEKDAKIAELTEEANRGKIEAAIAKAIEGKEHAGHLRRALTYGFALVEEKDGQPVEVWHAAPKTVEEVAERAASAEAFVKSLVEEFKPRPGEAQRDSFRGTLASQPPSDNGEEKPKTAGPLTEEDMGEVMRLAR